MLLLAPMTLRYIFYALWIIPLPVFVCLAIMMFRRKIHSALPWFFAYAAFQVVELGLGYLFYHWSQVLYYYAYWAMATLDIALGFAVMYEVFMGVFHPFPGLHELGKVLFRWAALVLILATVFMAWTSARMPGNPLFSTLLNLTRSLEVMQCGLVLLMLLCSSCLGLTLRHRIFGIALGFGVSAAVDLCAATVLATMGQQAAMFVKLSKMVAFNFSALLWIGYIHFGAVEIELSKLIHVERWNFALAAAMPGHEESPALPSIESAVDRVWKKANGSAPNGSHHADQ